MADDRHDDRPEYTVYRSRPRLLRGRESDDIGALRDGDRGRRGGGGDGGRGPRGQGKPRRRLRLGRRPITPGRVLKWLILAVVGWLLLSLALFLISAQIESSKTPAAADAALSGGRFPLTSPNTILVIGTDARPEGSKEPGATLLGSNGPQRTDTIMLLRLGGGANAQLSILRDTVVDIPGHGRTKINAAYAYGGPALTIKTVEQYLGIPINHLIQVNFDNFPQFVDALGGITYTGGCVHSEISGGRKNGGYTLKLRKGSHHLNGKQTLILARTRHNLCAPNEDDRDRVARQQKILSAMKSQLASPGTFFRLPWVSWTAPKAIQSDMGGPTLIGVVGAELLGGGAHRQVLRPSGFTQLADGESAVIVDDATKRAAVQRFLKG